MTFRSALAKRDFVADFVTKKRCYLHLFLFMDITSKEGIVMAKDGGTAVYIKEDINYSRKEDLENAEVEGIWLGVFVNHSKSFIDGIKYRLSTKSK